MLIGVLITSNRLLIVSPLASSSRPHRLLIACRSPPACHQVSAILLHLGSGASMAAIRNGRCVDTTMGMTPLEGLVMGTRAGETPLIAPLIASDGL